MADILTPSQIGPVAGLQNFAQRMKDMGDGTFAPVIATVQFAGPVAGASGYPQGATPLVSSATAANSALSASLAATAGKTNYCTGFEITAAGATIGAAVVATVTGLTGGTANYTFGAPSGINVLAAPLMVEWFPALPASAPNTAITVNLPALGLGNANAAITVHGFQV